MKSISLLMVLTYLICSSLNAHAQQKSAQQQLDERVQKFLNDKRNTWQDLNVPYEDGKILHDLILQKKYTNALEIGTSTGHSTIWIAWALSKTGGKLITIEIDGHRQKQAIQNVRDAGLSEYVDFRLADAHQLVKELPGPFDFVFSDADKDWYPQYFKDLDPKLIRGGCFTAHNVRNPYGGIREFLDYVKQLPGYTTTINNASRAGISISYKK
ncbi:MAG: class I SAM-dependent methyltransferase [Cyclobacteriaceae bacterium]|jgi:predicted O-methyltransferase YrrM|nr:class I SAM-dependent methyltransferase [Cyclobacteriaceae bacterium]